MTGTTKYKHVAVLTLGCSKNLVDTEKLIAMLEEKGIEVSENANDADAVIINTCGFIESAKAESLGLIFQASELKRRKKIKKLIVFGCLSERYSESMRNEIPHLDEVLGVNSYEQIIKALDLDYSGEYGRSLLTLPHYSYLKIAEGCNHRCSFCAIPLIRGKYISRPMEEIIDEAKLLAKNGVKEINIIAQDTTYYGRDTHSESKLPELLRRVSDIADFKWVRLLYTYPTGFPLELLEVIAERENICNYLDIPIQHISDKILKSMGRGANSTKIYELIDKIKSTIPDVSLRTTLIAGYPGESEEDFSELLQFVEKTNFSRLGVFPYSPEDGTPAFPLGDPISQKLKLKRVDRIMSLQQKISLANNKKLIGKEIEVLIDALNDKTYVGRTKADAPDIDNGVVVRSKETLNPGMFISGKVTGASEYDLEVQHIV